MKSIIFSNPNSLVNFARRGRKRGSRLTRSHKEKIRRSAKARYRGSNQIKNWEAASRIVRNLSLAAETPSKIGRNLAYTTNTLSRVSTAADRNLNRAGNLTRSANNIANIALRKRSIDLRQASIALRKIK